MKSLRDGVDIVFIKDGLVRILVRYRTYLLQYNLEGTPVSCTSSSLLDILMNFPHDKLNLADNGDEEEEEQVDTTSKAGDNSSVISANTVATRNSSESSSAMVSRVGDVDSLVSLFEVGTCFRTSEHDTVWKIRSVSETSVTAEVVNPGRNLTLENGDICSFCRSDKNLRKGLLAFNQ